MFFNKKENEEFINWQDHLADLENFYSAENFFGNQKLPSLSDNDLKENYFLPAMMDRDEIDDEGELSVDVYQDEKNIYVLAPLAGVRPDKVSLHLDKDILTIKGERENFFAQNDDAYLYRECFWGKFSRTLVLPGAVQESEAKAESKLGVLKITLPKAIEKVLKKIEIHEIEE